MRLVRTLVVTAAVALGLGAAGALACSVHAYGSAVSSPQIATSLDLLFAAKPKVTGVRVLANINPGGGYHADVFAHGRTAYLSSWHGEDCPGTGVRIIDLTRPSRPEHVATFADAAREPELRGTWTEKTIVREARTASFKGTIAVTSVQHCDESAFRGFALYDLTDPRTPRRLGLVRTEGVRGSHEIWLENARGRLWVYTAIVRSELLSSPDYDPKTRAAKTPGLPDFRIFDVTDPRHPRQVGSWGSWKALGIHPNDGRGVYPANLVHSVITDDAAKRAYLSHWDLGTVMLDISSPARLSRPHACAGGRGTGRRALVGTLPGRPPADRDARDGARAAEHLRHLESAETGAAVGYPPARGRRGAEAARAVLRTQRARPEGARRPRVLLVVPTRGRGRGRLAAGAPADRRAVPALGDARPRRRHLRERKRPLPLRLGRVPHEGLRARVRHEQRALGAPAHAQPLEAHSPPWVRNRGFPPATRLERNAAGRANPCRISA